MLRRGANGERRASEPPSARGLGQWLPNDSYVSAWLLVAVLAPLAGYALLNSYLLPENSQRQLGWLDAGFAALLVGTFVAGGALAQRPRMRRQQELIEERLAVMSALPDLFFKMTLDGTILAYQAGVESDLYLPPEGFLGRRMQDVLPADVSRQLAQALTELASGKRHVCFEYTLPIAGEGCPFEARIVPFRNDKVIAVVRNIRRRRYAEAELHRHREKLEELVEARTKALIASQKLLHSSERLAATGTLAAGIAHQINNPVGSILAAAQYAQRCHGQPDAAEVASQALDVIVDEATRCGRIVRDVLKFSRGEETSRQVESAGTLARRACKLCTGYASEREVTLELAIDESKMPVLVSMIELEETLVNLVHNAIEASSPGGRIEMRARLSSEGVEIVVRDWGRGIGAEALKNVFDPFYTTRFLEGGTGLGLSVSHGVVAAHGGKITIESEPGLGSTVSVTLPLADSAAG